MRAKITDEEPRGEIDGITDGRIIHSVARAEMPNQSLRAMQSEACLKDGKFAPFGCLRERSRGVAAA